MNDRGLVECCLSAFVGVLIDLLERIFDALGHEVAKDAREDEDILAEGLPGERLDAFCGAPRFDLQLGIPLCQVGVVGGNNGSGHICQFDELTRSVVGSGFAPTGEVLQDVEDGLIVAVGLFVACQGISVTRGVLLGEFGDERNLEDLAGCFAISLAFGITRRIAFFGFHFLGGGENAVELGLGGGFGLLEGRIAHELE